MDVLFFLVPIALALAGLFVVAFRWATQNNQFDDLNTPALRILLEEEGERPGKGGKGGGKPRKGEETS